MKNVVMFPSDDESWKNFHLLKEIGLIPFLFTKELKYQATIVTGDFGPYLYLSKYIPEVKMDILVENTSESRLEYIASRGRDIDILILSGVYYGNLDIAREYKSINPDGKVWLLLDMNIAYADYLFYEHPELKQFDEYCDLITTTSRRMQKYLNYKWEWPIFYFPHTYHIGLFNYSVNQYDQKENVILTVGRLGDWQKGTEILLESFAKNKEKLKDWKLKLVGKCENDFRNYLDTFFVENPELTERILFLGQIDDKEELVKEYNHAKVFALPSRMEGGMANVMVEAMRSGCAMLVTKFEAYDEAIVYGDGGMASDIDEVEGFAENMLNLCTSDELERYCRNSYCYAVENFDGRKNIKYANELIFGANL